MMVSGIQIWSLTSFGESSYTSLGKYSHNRASTGDFIPNYPANDIGWDADGYLAGQPVRVPHPSRSGTHPAGGNILFADGSANWVKFENMYFMNTFSLGIARCFAYQEDWGSLTSIQVARMQPLSGDFN
jgi:prepilin-type processing-associated H-X9-DG protein